MASYSLNKTKEEIIALYLSGASAIKIAAICNCNYSNIYSLLSRLGINRRSNSINNRKYDVNHDYFNNIDTETKAYILGFLYADGYNNEKTHVVKLSLQEGDKEILKKISMEIQPDKPLNFLNHRRRRSLGQNVKDSYVLNIVSQQISKKLAELGCTQQKTFSIVFPTEKQVPKQFQRHFIRGYFDGDGCVTKSKNGLKFNLVGTESFLYSIREILMNVIGLKKNHISKRGNIFSLDYCGSNCLKIESFLYKDSTIRMDRKYNKFKNERKK